MHSTFFSSGIRLVCAGCSNRSISCDRCECAFGTLRGLGFAFIARTTNRGLVQRKQFGYLQQRCDVHARLRRIANRGTSLLLKHPGGNSAVRSVRLPGHQHVRAHGNDLQRIAVRAEKRVMWVEQLCKTSDAGSVRLVSWCRPTSPCHPSKEF